MNIFKMFGINKHMPTPQEYAEHLNNNPHISLEDFYDAIKYSPKEPEIQTDAPSEGAKVREAHDMEMDPDEYKRQRDKMRSWEDAQQDFDDDVDPRFEREPEIKPFMSTQEARKAGVLTDRKPDPEPGTVSRNVRQRTSGGYPDKEKIIRKPGDYINPPYGESDLDAM